MSRLELLDGTTIEEFLGAEAAVLTLAKQGCEHCVQWTGELEQFLASDETWRGVRFGKLNLSDRGLGAYRRANPWLTEIDQLPFHVLYRRGVRSKSFAGGGVERLVRRLTRVFGAPPAPSV